MIISFTGHRNIGGYTIPNPTYNKVKAEIESLLLDLKPDKILSGMAIGADMLAAIC